MRRRSEEEPPDATQAPDGLTAVAGILPFPCSLAHWPEPSKWGGERGCLLAMTLLGPQESGHLGKRWQDGGRALRLPRPKPLVCPKGKTPSPPAGPFLSGYTGTAQSASRWAHQPGDCFSVEISSCSAVSPSPSRISEKEGRLRASILQQPAAKSKTCWGHSPTMPWKAATSRP